MTDDSTADQAERLDELTEQLQQLQKRVGYLEQQTGHRYTNKRLRAFAARMFHVKQEEVDIQKSTRSRPYVERWISVDELARIEDRCHGSDAYEWRVNDAREGEVLVRVTQRSRYVK